MPFLRHSRDKRGYETTFVMHTYRPSSGQAAGKTRLLYMFRTPSNRKVGRNLLEPEVMEALEHTHPDLTFDWQGMLRAPQATAEPEKERDRPRRGDRERSRDRGSRPSPESGPRQPAPEAPLAIVEDDSLLGRVAGAAAAARMRTAYAELIQRIARRARTPEERDRLTDRAGRLNPDEWPDTDAITAAVAVFDTEFEAIRQELPRRRRGRRGGRSKDRDAGGSAIIGHGANEDSDVVGETRPDDGSVDRDLGSGDADAGAADGDPIHDVD